MTFRFVPAFEVEGPLTIAISIAGGSGTGKTYSALRLARGIANGGKIGVIDTENRRALHYRAEFPEMVHCDFSPIVDGKMVGFPPERWIQAIDDAEAAGLPVVVIDSFSHAWEGLGGVLEMQAEELERLSSASKSGADQSMRAWAVVKPRFRRLVERIIRARCHTIICVRAKPMIQARDRSGKMVNATKNKIRRPDLPWDIAADKDLVFEMTCSLLMTPEQPVGVPIPLKCADAFKPLFASGQMLSEAQGKAMHAWSAGQTDQRAKQAMDEARQIARRGTVALKEHWRSMSRDAPERVALGTIAEELKALALAADDAQSDDPFAGLGGEPVDGDPDEAPVLTPEQIAERDAAFAEMEAERARDEGEFA